MPITIVRAINIKTSVELEGKNTPEPSHVNILPKTIFATSNEGKRNKIHAKFTKRNVINIRMGVNFWIEDGWQIFPWDQCLKSFLYTVTYRVSIPKK